MNKKILIQTAVISGIFFVMLYLVSLMASLAPEDGGIKIESVYVFIALAPFFIWLITSGKLKELKGPGGIGLLMRDEAERRISLEADDTALELDPEIVRGKGGMQSLAHMMSASRPTALSFKLERKNYYNKRVIKAYLDKLGTLSEFKNIIFTSAVGTFAGYMKVDDFSSFIEQGVVVEELESGSILQSENVFTESINISSSNKEALSAMEKFNVNELAVVDSSNRFLGIINQDKIVRKVLSKLVIEA